MDPASSNTHGRRGRSINDDNNIAANHQRKKPKTNNAVSSPRDSSSISSRTRKHTRSVSSSQQCARIMSHVEIPGTPTKIRNTRNKELSTLESLPLEIVERIFFYSLNVNLPRASPHLAIALSGEHVYRLLILLAFWDNDERHDMRYNSYDDDDVFGGSPARYEDLGTCTWRENPLFSIPHILRPLGHDYFQLGSQRRRSLQTSILGCKWCTEDRIRKRFPDLARLTITRWCINAGYMFEDEKECRELEKSVRSDYEEGRRVFSCHVFRGKKLDSGEWKEENEDEYQHCRIIAKTGEYVAFDFSDNDRKTFPGLSLLWFPILCLKEIPASLFLADINATQKGRVRGFFTDAHLSLLNTIRFSGQLTQRMPCMLYQKKVAYCRDALQEGIHTAISTNNPRALDILLKFDGVLYHGSRLYRVPSDHFRTAVKVYFNIHHDRSNNRKHRNDAGVQKAKDDALLCFCLLLTSSEVSLPQDPVIVDFAELVGGAFGQWLLEFVAVLPGHASRVRTDFDNFALFIEREPNDFSELGEEFYNVTNSREIFSVPAQWMKEGDDD